MAADSVRHNEALDALPDVFIEVDAHGRVTRYHGGGAGDAAVGAAQLVGSRFQDRWPRAAATRMHGNIRKAIANREGHSFKLTLGTGASTTYEIRLFVRARNRVLAVLRPLRADAGPQSCGPARDALTGLKTYEQCLIDLEDSLADAALRERPLGLLCVDIDGLTRINEALGRRAGDTVLRAVAQRLRDGCTASCASPCRCMLARIGADEFVVVFSNIASEQAMVAVAERLAAVLGEPVPYEDLTLAITASIGMAGFPQHGRDAAALIRHARAALDESRDTGVVGGVLHDDARRTHAASQLDLARELRWAIEQQQMELHYVPRIDLATTAVTAVEASLCWRHPVLGLVPASELVPLAEATGLMPSIGAWAVDAACEMAAKLSLTLPMAPTVCVNLTRQGFLRLDLVDLVAGALARSALADGRLQLGFTEAGLARHRHREKTLQALAALGVGLVVDDLGSGRMSLSGLRALPIEAVKIDASLVAGIGSDTDREAVCAAMIAMGRELGLAVIAKGVATRTQLQFLGARQCDAAQGPYYSRPLAPGEVLQYLAPQACAASST